MMPVPAYENGDVILIIEPKCARVLDSYFEVNPTPLFLRDFLVCAFRCMKWFSHL